MEIHVERLPSAQGDGIMKIKRVCWKARLSCKYEDAKETETRLRREYKFLIV